MKTIINIILILVFFINKTNGLETKKETKLGHFIYTISFCDQNKEKLLLDSIFFDEINIENYSQEAYLKELLNTIRKTKTYGSLQNLTIEKTQNHKQPEKDWTILIYIAGDNDLYKFALRNIEQLKQIGSNEKLNILIHFDFHQDGKQKETKRYYVERNKLIQIGSLNGMDSGSEKTLIDACSWAIKNYPSKYLIIDLWNHGSGEIDPARIRQLINPNKMFFFDPVSKKITLDRNITFLDFLLAEAIERGICFDDTTGNYLTNAKLSSALKEIVKIRNGKKIDIILMDACLMAGVGTATLCCEYANFLCASEEVVLGPGYNYAIMLKPLIKRSMTPELFARNVVETYEETYAPVTQDYTQSCFNLSFTNEVIENINELVDALLKYINIDKQGILKKTIRICSNKDLVTHFSEPSYIDFKHFLENILTHTSKINLQIDHCQIFNKEIPQIIQKLIKNLNRLVFMNVKGRINPKASGIYIYFPNIFIDSSYKKTLFAKKCKWITLLEKVL
jgi:hypothetical protein